MSKREQKCLGRVFLPAPKTDAERVESDIVHMLQNWIEQPGEDTPRVIMKAVLDGDHKR